jgi:hypothetical protein
VSTSSDTERPMHDVRLVDAAPGWVRIRGHKVRVLRGTLLPEHFGVIHVPPYQRRLMTTVKHQELIDALGPEGIGVPDDLLLCTRAANYRSVGSGELILRTDALYTLDGLQRFGAAIERLKRGQTTDPFGVKILIGTTEALELDLFYQVNRLQTKVATHVHLRNAGTNATLQALRKMAENTEGFPTVQWDQQQQAREQITAHMLYETAIILHGYAQGRDIEGILEALDELSQKVGTERMTENVQTFFALLDRCFGGTAIAPFIRRVGLLRGMAMLFGTYQNFWDGQKLLVRKIDILKIRSIKWDDMAAALQQNNAAGAVCRRLELHLEKARPNYLKSRRS